MDKVYTLDDIIPFGEFTGMSVRQAAELRPKNLFKMQNGTIFNIDKEALAYIESKRR